MYTRGGYNYYRNPVASVIQTVTSFIMLLVILFTVSMFMTSMSKPKNDIPRVKLETGNAFDNNCIDDQIGWFNNTSSAAAKLKKFWQATGVQPYIILKADDGTLSTDSEKDAWLEEFYNNNIAPRQDAFVYCYFYEDGEEYSNVPSYMGYASGQQASSVMDAMAVDIFWGYIDRYWVSDMSTDEMFASAFNSTGETIMTVSTTGKDIVKYIIILVITIVVGVVVCKLARVWFKDRRERAAEDERILNSNIGDTRVNPTQDLEDRYLN